MNKLDVDRWEDLEAEIRKLEDKRRTLAANSDRSVSEMLFRGQPNASWGLETTLERTARRDVSLKQYYRWISVLRPEVESLTERRWDLPPPDDFETFISKEPFLPVLTPAYEFMAHLRHHGFPSPFLDWAASPYVAAFFAFRDPPDLAERVAFYAYLEDEGFGHGGWAHAPRIHALGPVVRTHKRHYLQRSQYTFCSRMSENGELVYCPHDEVFKNPEPHQDLLWKITVPVSERPQALSQLDRSNLNAFSLFGTEDSLMEALAARRFVIEHCK